MHENVLWILKRGWNRDNELWKEENDTISKGLHEKYRSVTIGKTVKENTLMIKIIVKLKTIVMILVNADVLQIVYIMKNIVYLKKFL